MATNARREIELALNITTANAQALGALRDDVKELAKEGGAAAPEFKRLADELTKLEAQAKQLQVLDGLTSDLATAAQRMEAAGTEAARLNAEYDRLKQATEDTAAAQRAANADYERQRAAVRAAGADIAKYRAEADSATQKTDAYAAKLQELKQAAAAAKVELAAKAKTLADAKANAEEAAAAQAKLTTQVRDANGEYRRATNEVKALEAQVNTVGDRLVEAGASSGKFADAQAEIVGNVNQVREALRTQTAEYDRLQAAQTAAEAQARKLESLNAQIALSNQRAAQSAKDRAAADKAASEETQRAQREAAQAAEEAAGRIDGAFRAVGIRSAQELRAEIANVRTSMELLGQSGTLTGRELDAAMRQGNLTIKSLERDLREATGQLTLMDRATGALKTTFGQVAAFVSLQEVVTRTASAFYDAVRGIQSMELGLKAIYGEADTASQQIEFLRKTANSAGVAVSDISAAFTKFSASTKEANIPIGQSNELFAELVRVAGVLGLSSVKTEQALEALGQMAAKGTVSMEELRQQLGDALPGALGLVAKGLGKTTEELIAMVEAGQLTANQLFPALTAALKTFEGQNNTLAGAVARVKNAITEFYQSASNSTAIQALTGGLNALAENFGRVVDVIYGFGKALLALKLLDFVSNLRLFSSETAIAAGEVAKKAAAVAQDTAATTANTAATNANTAAKAANATVWGSVVKGLADSSSAQRDNAKAWGDIADRLGTTGKAAADTAAKTGVLAKGMDGLRGVAGLVGGALGTLGTGLRAVFTLLGGWPMLIATVALNLKDLGTWIGETAAKWMGYGKQMEEAERKTKEYEAAEKARAAAKEEAMRKATQGLEKEIEALTKSAKALKDKADIAEKATAAEKIRAENIEKLVALYGTEAEKAAAAAQAAGINVAAMENEAKAKRELLAASEAELAAKTKLIAETGNQSQKYKELAADLGAKVEKMREESAAADNTLRQLQLEAAQRKVASETLKDNSARLGEYRGAMEAARENLAGLIEMQKQGLPVGTALAKAETDLAVATSLYRDASADAQKAIDLKTKSKTADLQLSIAGLNAQLEEAKASERIAIANGNETEARRQKIKQKEIELQIFKLTVEYQRIEAQGALDIAKAKLQEAKANDPLNKVKILELETTIKLAEAQLVLAKARGQQVDALERELTNLRNNTNAKNQNRDASNGTSNALAQETQNRLRNVNAIEEENDRLAEQNGLKKIGSQYMDRDGFSANADGSRITYGGQLNIPDGYYFDAAAANRDPAFTSGKIDGSKYIVKKPGSGTAGAQGAGVGGGSNLPGRPAPVPAPAASTGGTRTIRLQLGNGATTNVNVASLDDAAALESFLSQLQTSAGRSI